MYKIKVKQLTSGSFPYGDVLVADGNGNTIFTSISGITRIGRGNTFPSVGSAELFYRTDVDELFYYDNTRSKWLTTETFSYICGNSSINRNASAYMYVANAVQSSTTGFVMPRNGTIVSASVDNGTTVGTTRNLEIRVNNSTTNRVLLPITSGNKSNSINDANQDFSVNDRIQVIALANGNDNINNIIVTFNVSYRI